MCLMGAYHVVSANFSRESVFYVKEPKQKKKLSRKILAIFAGKNESKYFFEMFFRDRSEGQ